MSLFNNIWESKQWRRFVEYDLKWIPITILCLIIGPLLLRSAFKPTPEPERQIPPMIEPEGEIHTFTFSPEDSKSWFGLYPDEFCEQKGEESIVENAYVSAHVNDNGDLILEIADNQLLEWKKRMSGIRLCN